MCLPHMLPPEENMFKANELYDMQLILEGLTNEKIVLNNIRIEKITEGLLCRGPNTSGKTALLRAIGTAQIFAQAGLPVCASAASMSIRNAVFTQFSSSEKEFNAGDVAGRFEGEVQEVAGILDDLVPYSLILLNETFQTTSYAEGAQGIAHILEVLPNTSAKYVFVTRLTQLFDWFDPAKVSMMEFGGSGDNAYKVAMIER